MRFDFEGRGVMRFSKMVQIGFAVVLFSSLSPMALADTAPAPAAPAGSATPSNDGFDACSDAQIAQGMANDAANAAKAKEQRIDKGWQKPGSFGSLYCAAQIKTIFDTMGTSLGGAFYNMLKQLLTNLVNQACASAIAPIQNAASQLCIPFFSAASFNISLGLPTGAGFCNGMQLLSVTPTTTRPSATTNMNYTRIPLLP